jgi:FkbM family methyltransferase
MTSQIKQLAKRLIRWTASIIGGSRVGRYLISQILITAMEHKHKVCHNGVDLKIIAPNTLCDWRARTFSSKEPETLEWIDTISEGAVLWDVGANIGLYSIYAAKKRRCRVFAFEPSVFNLELLARNTFVNDLSKQICIVPLPLNDYLGASQMHMTTTELGGALSTFDRNFGWNGEVIRQVFEFQTIGLSMDDVVHQLAIPAPDYIKMDVDGLEHFILMGGREVLSNIKGILIEVNDDFYEQAGRCRELLEQSGLILLEKRHSEIVSSSIYGFQNCYNQIWIRP